MDCVLLSGQVTNVNKWGGNITYFFLILSFVVAFHRQKGSDIGTRFARQADSFLMNFHVLWLLDSARKSFR